MSRFRQKDADRQRVQALGEPFVEGFVRNIQSGIIPTRPFPPLPPQRPRPPFLKSRRRSWPCRILVRAVLVVLLGVICFVSYHLCTNLSSPPRPLLKAAFHSRDLAIAKSCSDTVWFTLHQSTVPSHDELLSSLRNLSSELSQGVQTASLLSSHIGVDLSYLIKVASNTERCSDFARVGPSISTAQNYIHQLLSSLDASRTICSIALSHVAVEHANAQHILASALKDAQSLWERLLASTSSARAEEKLRSYERMENWSSMLANATRDLQVGSNAVNMEMERFAQLKADMRILEKKAIEALHTGQTEERQEIVKTRCTISGLQVFEQLFLDMVFKVTKNDTDADYFYGHYKALEDGSNIYQRVSEWLEEPE
jgi:hypothetical protein